MAERVSQLDNGVTVFRVTDDPQLKDNIYCERSYCTPDSRWFVFERNLGPCPSYPWKYYAEYVACEFGSWRMRSLGQGVSYPEVSEQGTLYHVRHAGNDSYELVRLSIATGHSDTIRVDGSVKPLTGMTISHDERHLAYGVDLGYSPQMFGVEVVDLVTGKKRIVCRDPDICNPHPQFEPGEGRYVLVQHNRGCEFAADGTPIRWVGDQGATLFVASIDDGSVTRLQIGPPHTSSVSGHQQWIAATGEVLLTVSTPPGSDEPTLLAASVSGGCRALDCGLRNHVNVSRCGRFFCCDSVVTGDIVVGSTQTGEWRHVCTGSARSRAEAQEFGQMADAHPYLSPDLRWVVFQSLTTGRPQIYAASVPPGLLHELG